RPRPTRGREDTMLGVDIDRMRAGWMAGQLPSLQRRRRIATLAALSAADFAFLSLYQLGVLRRLPDLPGRLFDSNRVNVARKAYARGGPDAPIAAALNGLILALASFGGTQDTGRPRLADWLLGAAVVGGALASLDYFRDMVLAQQRICLSCVVAAGASFAMVPFALGELRARR
ncbi:MAG: vitamin K epoxide reductase family protein, partial [Myxococcales bacterium]